MNKDKKMKKLLSIEREARETDVTLEDLSPLGNELSGNVFKSKQLNAQRLLALPAVGKSDGMMYYQQYKDAVIAQDTLITLRHIQEQKKTEKIVDDQVTQLIQDPQAFWWGHSKEHGWVILDRSIEPNKAEQSGDLVFFKCRDGKIFTEKRQMWLGAGRYVHATRYFNLLNSAEMKRERTEFLRLKAQSLEFHREILRQFAEMKQAERKHQQEVDEERRQKEIIKIEEARLHNN